MMDFRKIPKVNEITGPLPTVRASAEPRTTHQGFPGTSSPRVALILIRYFNRLKAVPNTRTNLQCHTSFHRVSRTCRDKWYWSSYSMQDQNDLFPPRSGCT